MNYSQLYDLVRDICIGLDYSVKFFHGRKELILETTYDQDDLYCYLLPFTSLGTFTNRTQQKNEQYAINIIFYKQDELPSGIDANNDDIKQREIEILEITNIFADAFLSVLNDSDKVEIVNFTKGNAIKDTPHLLTGTTLTVNVRVWDEINYC